VTHLPEHIAKAITLIEQWETLQPYSFPKTEAGVTGLAKSMLNLTGPDMARAEQFADLVLLVSPRCPTPLEMRKVYCQKWKPADGIEDSALDYERFFGPGRKREE
jgi:hypothetical protein